MNTIICYLIRKMKKMIWNFKTTNNNFVLFENCTRYINLISNTSTIIT